MSKVSKFKLFCGEPKQDILIQSSSGKVNTVKLAKPTVVQVLSKNKILIKDKKYSLPVKLYSSGRVVINDNVYPGEVEILPTQHGINIINYVPLEVYLYGVIPYEIEPSWSDEMLKIQSVIARTYTIANLGRHKSDNFDFCSTLHCQLYKGIPKDEKLYLRIKKIVDSTRGLVVVDKKGNIVTTYYHACCGGHTENVAELWNIFGNYQPLSGVKCIYCKTSPYYNWDISVSQHKFATLFYSGLQKKKYRVKVEKIYPLKKSSTGRVLSFVVQWNDNTSSTITVDELSSKIGYTKIKSGKIDNININDKEITFYGRGWGHGVGLCQWGANMLTLQGKKFNSVIKFYFPGTKITVLR